MFYIRSKIEHLAHLSSDNSKISRQFQCSTGAERASTECKNSTLFVVLKLYQDYIQTTLQNLSECDWIGKCYNVIGP